MIVRVIGDDRSLQAAMARDQKAVATFGNTSTSSLQKFDDAFTRTQKIAAGGFLGGAAVTAGLAAIKTSVDAASDLNEQITKNQQVFGQSSKAIQEWSETTAQSLGVSESAALTATGTFGNLFKALGVGNNQSANTSKRLVQLASDLASFNNANPEDVLEALRSGLIGEAEPLRKFGVLLSEARVQQVAMAESGKTSAKELTNQEKALARVNIIFKDTTAAQGDFARTSGGLANQQRILAAQTANLQANMGNLLLPAMVSITTALNDASEAAITLADGLNALGSVKIPPIHIPFVFDTPGGTLGGLASKAAKLGVLGQLSPTLLYAELIKSAVDKIKGGSGQAQPKLSSQMADVFNGFFQNALDDAGKKIKPPKVTKGFGTGLKPEDLFGKLQTELPVSLQEALLDAQTLTPKALGDDLKVLKKQQEKLLSDIGDPRLSDKQRVALKKDLESVLGQIETTEGQIAAKIKTSSTKREKALKAASAAAKHSKAAQEKQFSDIVQNLEQKLNVSEATKGFNDDLKVSEKIEKAITAQIKRVGKTKDLLTALSKARQDVAKAQEEVDQARQFRKLGLSITGGEVTPGRDNLLKQFSTLSSRLKVSGKDISSKLESQFKLAGKLLKDSTEKNLKDPTLEAIRDLFQSIRGEFDKESKKELPLTKNSSFNASKIIEGLGLGPDTEKIIRQRVNAFNNADAFKAFNAPKTTSSATVAAAMVVENHNTITLDGEVVGRNVTRSQQKTARRNPRQKRGPNRNI